MARKETPDEDIFLSPGNLYIVYSFTADSAREPDHGFVRVDPKIEIRITLQERADAVVHFQFREAGEETKKREPALILSLRRCGAQDRCPT